MGQNGPINYPRPASCLGTHRCIVPSSHCRSVAQSQAACIQHSNKTKFPSAFPELTFSSSLVLPRINSPNMWQVRNTTRSENRAFLLRHLISFPCRSRSHQRNEPSLPSSLCFLFACTPPNPWKWERGAKGWVWLHILCHTHHLEWDFCFDSLERGVDGKYHESR